MVVESSDASSKNVLLDEIVENRYRRASAVIERSLHESDWSERVVFDVACGTGGYGRPFLDRGADVYFFDGRRENLDSIPRPIAEDRKFAIDLENESFPQSLPKADLVLLAGLLYHVGNPRSVLESVASLGDDILIECSTLDHDGIALIYFEENNYYATTGVHSSLYGRACRPSPGWLVQNLEEVGFAQVADISHRDANDPPAKEYSGHCYDWDFERTCGWRRNGYSLRKLMIGSKNPETSVFKW